MKDDGNYKGLLSRVWAEKKINELDIFYKRNEKEITSLGKKYEVVTRNTSMIVLDRLEDYLTHHIVPKNPELRKNYFAALSAEEKTTQQQLKDHLNIVVEDFNEMKSWYETDYYSAWLKMYRYN